jgi:hypothetical protein
MTRKQIRNFIVKESAVCRRGGNYVGVQRRLRWGKLLSQEDEVQGEHLPSLILHRAYERCCDSRRKASSRQDRQRHVPAGDSSQQESHAWIEAEDRQSEGRQIKDDNLSRKIPLEYAAEIRQQAREIRQKSKQVHAKSRQIRETVESRSGSRS